MREIKFRAWIKNENIMSNCNSFQSINFDITGGVESIINVMFGVESRISKDGEYYPEQYQYLDKFLSGEFDLMQYTGLKDKNGKEIYEGDIVIIQDEYCNYEQSYNEETDTYTNIEKHKIVWEDDNVCFNLRKLNGDYLDEPFYWENLEIEVIGNIYENPELLKGGKE